MDDANNCGPVSTDTITILDETGINDLYGLGLKIYPNPTSGEITIEMTMEAGEAILEVMSLTGQVVISREVYSSGGVLEETFDVSGLEKGMYMLRVGGLTLTSGFVVN